MVLGILVGAVALFVSEKYPIDFVALLVLGALLALGLVTPEEGISGFSNPATVTVAAMFVLSAGLQKTGATAVVGQLMVRFGRSYFTALVVIMGTIGVMSAFINNTAAVAVFIPLVMVVANRRKIAASRLLIPLSYASQFGGVCTLIGTSTNLLVSSISEQSGYGAFSMFEFSRMGLVLFVTGVLFFLIFGKWLLPERKAQELAVTYQLGEYITELRVAENSPLVGKSVLESRLGEDHDVTILRLLHVTKTVWAPLRQALTGGDVLLVRGRLRELMRLRDSAKLELNAEFKLRDESASIRGSAAGPGTGRARERADRQHPQRARLPQPLQGPGARDSAPRRDRFSEKLNSDPNSALAMHCLIQAGRESDQGASAARPETSSSSTKCPGVFHAAQGASSRSASSRPSSGLAASQRSCRSS